MSAGRLFFSDRYGYRFYVTPQRNKKHDNQLNHTSHLLSEVWPMMKLLVILFALLREVKTVTITIRKK